MTLKAEIPMDLDPGSFRDPSGQVFSHANTIYRSIFKPGLKDYERVRDEGIYDKLIRKGLLLPHEQTKIRKFCPKGTLYCLSYQKIPLVSYPWEWSFSMLKDAALIHLDMMEMLVPEGFWLRDANAFNVQFDGSSLKMIDTLSIGRRMKDTPWIGYQQFCAHFLAPLSLAAFRDIRMLSLWRTYLDGFPLDLVKKLLPPIKKYHPKLYLHLTLHSTFQETSDREEDLKKNKETRKIPKVSERSLIGTIRSLRRTVQYLKYEPESKIWKKYQSIRTYREKDVKEKADYVHTIIKREKPQLVWDLGGNIGEFSTIAAENGAFVASIEGDPACTECLYREVVQKKKNGRILPLTMDLSNPSPPTGWAHKERPGLTARGPADMVLALALIHHLVFSANIPLVKIAEWFGQITSALLVEFIPPTDPMVKKLKSSRLDEHLPYSMDEFQSGFDLHFNFVDKKILSNHRTIFFLKK